MSIAIVIPTSNNYEYLLRCLETLIDYTDHDDYRVMVVDNGSTDETPKYLQDIKQRAAGVGREIDIITSDRNLGFISGTNLGLRQLGAKEHPLLLNDDTQVTDRFWLGELEYQLEQAGVGAVGPVSNTAMGLQEISWSSQLPLTHEMPFLQGFCLLINKAAFDQIGLLDENFGVNMFDDIDYSIRLRDAGYKLICDRQAFVYHYGHVTLYKEKDQYDARLAEGRRLIQEKYGYEKWMRMQQLPESVKQWIVDTEQRDKPSESSEPQAILPEQPQPWDSTYQTILHPIATDDYIGGAWPEIRYEKVKAFFQLAQEVGGGTVVELGTYRGLGAIALASGVDKMVYTIDDYTDKEDLHHVHYGRGDYVKFSDNIERLPVDVSKRIIQYTTDAITLAEIWKKPIDLVVWDLGNGEIPQAFEVWAERIKIGGVFAVKDDGTLDKEWFYSRPGWEKYREFPDGMVYSIKKALPGQPTVVPQKLLLNIGAGQTRIDGFVNIDLSKKADMVVDIGRDKLPYPDNSADMVFTYHTLEHIPDYLFALGEIWRVLKHGSFLMVGVPYLTLTKYNLVNPYHLHNFNEYSFDFFDPDKLKGSAAEDNPIQFKVLGYRLNYVPEYVGEAPEKRDWARNHLFNVVESIDFVLAAIKDGSPLTIKSTPTELLDTFDTINGSRRKYE